MSKILMCFGTRPEAIKMAPLYHQLKRSGLGVVLCVTGQHREMLDQVMEFFEMIPDFDLNVMAPDQSLNALCSKIIAKIDKVFDEVNPKVVLVHGDTTTSSMIALAAFHRGIKIGHVEAGLRTYNLQAPFPEEMNRQLTGRLANFHFTPTDAASNNLINENIDERNILKTGNTVVDALLWTTNKLAEGYSNKHIEKLKGLLNKKMILVTGHRRENFGEGFSNLCRALLLIAKDQDVNIVFPVHLNPQVSHIVNSKLGNKKNIYLTEPVPYPTMVWLIQNCDLIISDSGGIQEEAPTFGKHVLVTREVSERPEGLAEGCSTLVGTDVNRIVNEATERLHTSNLQSSKSLYGDGKASERIVDFLEHEFSHS